MVTTPASAIATVLDAALCTVQDGGRRGYEQVGVPVAGALHRERYLTAAGLLTGRLDDRVPALELLGGRLVLRTLADTVLVVVGPVALDIDDRPAAPGCCLAVHAGQQVVVAHRGPGPAYVAVDGWAPEPVLGSVSTDTFSGIGPPPVVSGAVLEGPGSADSGRVGAFHRALPDPVGPIRVAPADDGALADVARRPLTVSAVARSGIRLAGADVAGRGSIASQPMVRGAIQLTPSGEAIVLGPDGGLTGGYPVLGVVIAADLDRLSLLAIGDAVSFAVVTVAEAAFAHMQWRQAIAPRVLHPDHLP